MSAKVLLTVAGLLYLGLGLWCSIRPELTSRKVGFELMGGSGKSEFLTVYGGLEVALGLVFLIAAFRADMAGFGLLLCAVLHGCLCLFRTISFVQYKDIEPFTYRLAIGEWVLLAATLVVYWLWSRGQGPS